MILQRRELGSNCCGAEVSESGICTECKEHAVNDIMQDVSAVLINEENDTAMRIVFSVFMQETDDLDGHKEIMDWLDKRYPNHKYVYDCEEEIEIEDLDFRD